MVGGGKYLGIFEFLEGRDRLLVEPWAFRERAEPHWTRFYKEVLGGGGRKMGNSETRNKKIRLYLAEAVHTITLLRDTGL